MRICTNNACVDIETTFFDNINTITFRQDLFFLPSKGF